MKKTEKTESVEIVNPRLPASITKVTLTDATFECSTENVINPTWINFFYGNNGSGKTTISRTIKNGIGIEWYKDTPFSADNVLVYNQDFVRDTFRNFGEIEGVFTLGKKEGFDVTAVEEKEKRVAFFTPQIKADSATMERIRTVDIPSENDKLKEDVWKGTAKLRSDFIETQGGYKKDKEKLLKRIRDTVPFTYDYDTMFSTCKKAFETELAHYNPFNKMSSLYSLPGWERIENCDLLNIPIVGTGESRFRAYIDDKKSSTWVKNGLDDYIDKNQRKQKCPFCQSEISEKIISELFACFDRKYEDDIKAIKNFRENYRNNMLLIFNLLNTPIQSAYPIIAKTEAFTAYSAKVAELQATVKSNIQTFDGKIADPSIKVELTSVRELCEYIDTEIQKFNAIIDANNAIADDNSAKIDCENKVWQMMAYEVSKLLSDHKT